MKITLDRELLELVAEAESEEERRRIVDDAINRALEETGSRVERAEADLVREREGRERAEDEAARRSSLLAQAEIRIAELEGLLGEERELRTTDAMSATRVRRRLSELRKMRNYFGAALVLVITASGLTFPVAFGFVNGPLGLTFLAFAAVIALAVAVSMVFQIRHLWRGIVALGGLLGLLVGIYELSSALFEFFSKRGR
jgi:hypothetical protein